MLPFWIVQRLDVTFQYSAENPWKNLGFKGLFEKIPNYFSSLLLASANLYHLFDRFLNVLGRLHFIDGDQR